MGAESVCREHKNTFDKVYNGVTNFFAVGSPARAEWVEWLTNIFPRTDDVFEYLRQNHEMKRPLESFFDRRVVISWAAGTSTVYEHTVVNELEPSDWEYPNMNTAVVQPSVVTRFNPHPPEHLAFFNNNTNFVETFLEVCDPYNDKVLKKMTLDSMKDILRFYFYPFNN